MALLRRFCVISGGPGTGKTYTVVKILALLAEQARGRPLAVALAAPTGKAAARVQEAVRHALERLPSDERAASAQLTSITSQSQSQSLESSFEYPGGGVWWCATGGPG